MTHGLDINSQKPQVVRIPLMDETDLRPGQEGLYTKDKFFLNGYFEPIKNILTQEIEYHFIKRPGTSRVTQVTEGAVAGRRIYLWGATNQVYVVTPNKIYGNSGTTDLGVVVNNVGSFGKVSIVETRPNASPRYLGVLAGGTIYLIGIDNSVIVMNNTPITTSSATNPTTITTSTGHGLLTGNKVIIRNHTLAGVNDTIFTITKTSNTTFTIPVLGGGTGGTIGAVPFGMTGDMVYMDGYWFVTTTASAINNCVVDDPTTWPAINTINVQMRPGSMFQTRLGSGGLAQQHNYIIAFTDRHFQLFIDAANPVGSPLQNVEQGMQQIGCFDNRSIAFTENTLYWVSNTLTGGLDVYRLDGTTNLQSISTPTLKRTLQQAYSDSSCVFSGFTVRYTGHIFYILHIQSATINVTFIYCQDLNIWLNWSNTSGTGIWPLIDCTQGILGSNILLGIHATDGFVYSIDQNVFQDNLVNFPVIMQANPLTFGTMARKFYNRVELVGDRQNSTANALVSFTDDDYLTFSPARTYDMSQIRTFSRNFGNSRRRAWKISYSGNTPLRVFGLEFTIELDVS